MVFCRYCIVYVMFLYWKLAEIAGALVAEFAEKQGGL